jgi:predicted CopG family antitoxin
MPDEGFKTITVRDSIYDIIEAVAKEEGRSLSNMVEWMAAAYTGRKQKK